MTKLKVSDFAKIEKQDGTQTLVQHVDQKIAVATSATQPSMNLTKFGGYTINWKLMNEILGVSSGDLFGVSCAISLTPELDVEPDWSYAWS